MEVYVECFNDVTSDANFGAYVVLHWPWSSDMNNSDSQVYTESIMKADHWVSEFVSLSFLTLPCAQVLLSVELIPLFLSFTSFPTKTDVEVGDVSM